MNRILCAAVFLGVVLKHDYLLCCYADLDVKEISWWQNKYLFLLHGAIWGKIKLKQKIDYLPLEGISLFYIYLVSGIMTAADCEICS